MQQIQDELKSDGWMKNTNKILAMLVKLLATECQLFKVDKQTGTATSEIKEQIMKFCAFKKGKKLDIKEATEKLTMSFKKEIPKMIEDMKKTETTVERSIDGVNNKIFCRNSHHKLSIAVIVETRLSVNRKAKCDY
uniref:E3 SUMO-protein ligase KIAA1586-like n=1 Tax=Globodera pallida TaxID=36090 RepID=A0A183BUT9_GLOPA